MTRHDCTTVNLQCPVTETVYGYRPSLGANAFFAAFFFAAMLANLVLGLRYKTWTYMLALVLCCLDEGLGYVGRSILHHNPWNDAGFKMQIVCLILGPAFNSAAIYLTLKHIALTISAKLSPIKPRLYTYIFISGDLIALILQAVGGGLAATSKNDPHRQKLGTHIMLSGIVWQIFTLVVFALIVIVYVLRVRSAIRSKALVLGPASKERRFKIFMAGVAAAYGLVLIRCIYRIPELAGGWGNSVMRNQPTYIALEGAMIALATCVQTILHPGYCFPQMSSKTTRGYSEQSTKHEEPLISIKSAKCHSLSGSAS